MNMSFMNPFVIRTGIVEQGLCLVYAQGQGWFIIFAWFYVAGESSCIIHVMHSLFGYSDPVPSNRDIRANELGTVDYFVGRDDPGSSLSHKFRRRQLILGRSVVVLCREITLNHFRTPVRVLPVVALTELFIGVSTRMNLNPVPYIN